MKMDVYYLDLPVKGVKGTFCQECDTPCGHIWIPQDGSRCVSLNFEYITSAQFFVVCK